MTPNLGMKIGGNTQMFQQPNLPIPPGGMFSLLANPRYCFKDASRTVPCNDGDPIYTWLDRFGSGLYATQPTPAYRPILRRANSNLWLAHCNGFNQWMTLPSGLSYSTQAATLYMAYVPVQTGIVQVPFRVGGGNVLNPYSNQTTDSADVAYLYANSTPNTTSVVNRSQLNVIAQLLGSSSSETRCNGVGTTGSAASAATETGGFIAANDASLNYLLAGAVAELLFFPSQLTDTVAAQVETYFSNFGYANFPYPNNVQMIVCDGASTTLGKSSAYGGSNYVAYPAQLYGLLSKPSIIPNLGVSSMPTPTMTSQAPTRTDPHFSAGRATNVVIAWEIINDVLSNGASSATAYANMKTYCAARKAAGWKVLLLNPDIPSGATSPQQTTIAGANTLLDADFTVATSDPYTFLPAAGVTYADAQLRIDQLTGLTFTDGYHYNAAGYAAIAQHVATALAFLGVS